MNASIFREAPKTREARKETLAQETAERAEKPLSKQERIFELDDNICATAKDVDALLKQGQPSAKTFAPSKPASAITNAPTNC